MSGDWSSDVCSSDLFPSHDMGGRCALGCLVCRVFFVPWVCGWGFAPPRLVFWVVGVPWVVWCVVCFFGPGVRLLGLVLVVCLPALWSGLVGVVRWVVCGCFGGPGGAVFGLACVLAPLGFVVFDPFSCVRLWPGCVLWGVLGWGGWFGCSLCCSLSVFFPECAHVFVFWLLSVPGCAGGVLPCGGWGGVCFPGA